MGIDWKLNLMILVGVIAQGGVTVPNAPTSFTATAVAGGSSVSLSWGVPFNGGLPITGYTLKRGETIIYSGPNTSDTDTGLSAQTAYTYTVFATNLIGNSVVATTSATTVAGVPSAPSLSVNGSSGGSLDNPASYSVSWTVPADNGSAITGYVIETYGYSEVWQFLYSTAGTSGTFGADVGGDYAIRVYAVNAIGNSAPSNAVGISWYDANPTPPSPYD
jgi:hypothetical protein